ncbi:MAG: DMT family transporter [Gaiellaceae bacterium]
MATATDPRRRHEATAVLFLLTAVFFWGTSFRATLIGAEHAPPLTFTALRAAPAALILLVVAFFMRARLPGRALLPWTVLTGVLMVTIPLAGLAESVVRAGAGNAAVLNNTAPFFVLALGYLMLSERASWIGISGLLVGFGGVVVMVSSQLGGVDDRGDFALGVVLALASAAAWGGGTLVVKWLLERDPKLDLVGLTVGQYLIGSTLIVGLAFAIEQPSETAWSSGDLWAAVAWVVVGSSVIAQLAFYAGLRRLPANKVAVWGFMAPVVAVLVEIGRGDVPGPIVGLGMGMAILGVAVTTVAPMRSLEPGGA